MKLTPISVDLAGYPPELRPLLEGAKVFDSSCSAQARVLFIDRDSGYFLKTAAAGSLAREAEMTRYFHGKGLTVQSAYFSQERDWLLTEKIPGEDCTAARYLEQPRRLCDTLAELLVTLHSMDHSGCPVRHMDWYLADIPRKYRAGDYDSSHFPDSYGYASAEDAFRVLETKAHLLQSDTLLHGDYCLPNVILNGWKLGGFVDVGNGGIGDRHVDIFWALWSLGYNLKTDKLRERFIDAYGRDKVDDERLRVVAAAEVFG